MRALSRASPSGGAHKRDEATPADPSSARVLIEPRSNNFDALRVLAALLVIWGHQFAVMGKPVPLFLGGEPGGWGVAIFFALSGYLVTLSWTADPNALRFALRRVLRIWPALCVAVLVCTWVLGPVVTSIPLRDYVRDAGTARYLSTLWLDVQFMLPGVFEHLPQARSVNGPLWTIPIEVACYAALIVAGMCLLLKKPLVTLTAFVALLAGIYLHYRPHADGRIAAWSFPLCYAVVFALGAVLAQFRALWRRWNWWFAAVLLAATWLLHATAQIVPGMLALAAFGAAALAAASASTPFLRRAGRFGDVSYGLYIYAFPLQQLVMWHFGSRLGFVPAFALSLAATLAAALLSWHLIEKPALRLKPRGRSAEPARAGEPG